MKDINETRKRMDVIDEGLVKLFLERMELVREVALEKRESGAAISDPAREREILSRVTAEAGEGNENAARLFFSTLFSISKARQRSILNGDSPLIAEIDHAMENGTKGFPTRAFVACCGAEGSFAQQAAAQMVMTPTIVYFNGFESVFEAVEKGMCPYGVLPVENSAAGSVSSVYDLMQKHRFHIVRSLRLKVDHALLALPGATLEGIRRVVSHPHALAQCAGFLKGLPSAKAEPSGNTAVAAKSVAASKRLDVAVIASRACADLYGLKILAGKVQDAVYNYTRFICISKELEIYPEANRISIMLSLPHRPGALAAIISKFAAVNVNLTKLESRPVPGMDFEFNFIFDFEASPGDADVRGLLSELSQDPEIERFEFLGAYRE